MTKSLVTGGAGFIGSNLVAGLERLTNSQESMNRLMGLATHVNYNDPRITPLLGSIESSQGIGNGAGQWLDGLGSSEGGGGAGVPPTPPQVAPEVSRQDKEAAEAAQTAGAGADVVKDAMNAKQQPKTDEWPDVPFNELPKPQQHKWMRRRPFGYVPGETKDEARNLWMSLYYKHKGNFEAAKAAYLKSRRRR